MKKILSFTLIIFSLPIMLAGILFSNFEIMMLADFVLWTGTILFALDNLKKRIIYLVFISTIFLFLMGRPIFMILSGKTWLENSLEASFFSILSIFISLFFLFIGVLIAERSMKFIKPKQNSKKNSPEYKEFLFAMQNFALILFYFGMACYFIMELEKLSFMNGREYEDYYMLFETTMPLIVRVIAGMAKPALALFLVTRPSKFKTFIPLTLFFISTIPMLVIGQRNSTVQAVLFIFVYYYIRDVIDNNPDKKWFGFIERSALLFGTPFALMFLSAYNYTRAGSVAKTGFFASLTDFFFHQGVSFKVLGIGYETVPFIPNTFKNYTFGPIIDYFTHSKFASIIFGAEYIGAVSSAKKALVGNSSTNFISYIALGSKYLKGHGWGSSYILESFFDFGWLGIIIISILLGIFMIYIIPIIKKNWFFGTIMIIALMNIFLIPRGETLHWLTIAFTPHFIVTILICYFAAKLSLKKYSLRQQDSFEKWTKPLYTKD